MKTINEVFPSAPMGRRVVFGIAFTVGVLLVIFGVNIFFAVSNMPYHGAVALRTMQTLAPQIFGGNVFAVDGKLLHHGAVGLRIIQTLVPLIPVVVLVPKVLYERSLVSRFRIEDNVLVLGRKRYPLEGLLEVAQDPDVLKRARKRFGNGGLGSIRGKFVSKRLGRFDTFLTGTENAVVLRWPDKVVAVSPADPEFFIYSAKAAAGIG
jgi:hypothetical protein